MDYLRQVQRGIDYIEEHLDEDIDVGEVARVAGISHWHFQRIFKGLTNETLKTYIRSRRLAGSLERLASTRERVIEIGLAAGFETQESFTRAFKKAFGVTPARYRRHASETPFLRKVRFDADYLKHIHTNVSVEPTLIESGAMRLVGVRTEFFGVDSEKNNIASKLPRLWSAFIPRLSEIEGAIAGICYGVVRQTASRTDELEYIAATEVSRSATVPRGMLAVDIPSARYAKFMHRGRVKEVDRTVNYIYSSWLARSGFRHTYGADLEFYDARYEPDSEHSVIHYAIPIA